MSAIYLHIPFCKRLCGYCDFFKSVKLQHLDAVLDAMEREVVAQRDFLSDHTVETIYFGGGTPSLVAPERIARLLEIIAQHYSLERLREVTIEVNPDDITPQYLDALRAAGVNRLSIGIQSFDDQELRFMNRRHSAAQAVESVRAAQNAGFDNITIDLIFGVEGFGEEVLRQSIATALSLGVQHISAYHLTIESGTPFARKVERGAMSVVSDEQSQREYEILERELQKAGYEHYEVSNYALPGFRSRHNSSYWQGVQYLGIGPAAHSYNGVERRFAVGAIDYYLAEGEERYESELLSLEDRYNELVMTSLRCCEGIDLDAFDQTFPQHFRDFLIENLKQWQRDGYIIIKNRRVFIPTEHFMISDAVIESLFHY
ncbi:MAG: radical SAM family heme chaperone HemW [Rikenellaceae bacterium]